MATAQEHLFRDTHVPRGYNAGHDGISSPEYDEKDEKDSDKPDVENGLAPETTLHEGENRFKKLGWKKLTVCLIVEAIALGMASASSSLFPLSILTHPEAASQSLQPSRRWACWPACC